RLAKRDAIRAFTDAPQTQTILSVEAREQTRIGGDRHGTRFTWLQFHALEPEEPHASLACRVSEVDLRHVPSRDLAGVRHGERSGHGLAPAHLEVLVVEAGVAQSVAERVQRLHVLPDVPAIADFRPLVVADRRGRSPRSLHAGQLRTRRLGET